MAINVTKTFLPPYEEYAAILKRAWDKTWITNNGELVLELEEKLKKYLGLKNLLFCNNGTVVLQMALKALGITKEVITTPFSYVATTNVILWEGCKPVFVDIHPGTFCINAEKIEDAITPDTQAILATHVFGNACNIELIETLANRYNLKVIYDGAHAFGCIYKGRSLLSYGDISTCSFHATKIFHTAEGGCIISNNDDVAKRNYLFRQFGHVYDDYYSVGINGKSSELHAAMGLANFKYVDDILRGRKQQSARYDNNLKSAVGKQEMRDGLNYNYSYYPILFRDEAQLINVKKSLNAEQIFPRRYFYPSLDELPFVKSTAMETSKCISKRIACLPLYHGLRDNDIDKISSIILKCVNS